MSSLWRWVYRFSFLASVCFKGGPGLFIQGRKICWCCCSQLLNRDSRAKTSSRKDPGATVQKTKAQLTTELGYKLLLTISPQHMQTELQKTFCALRDFYDFVLFGHINYLRSLNRNQNQKKMICVNKNKMTWLLDPLQCIGDLSRVHFASAPTSYSHKMQQIVQFKETQKHIETKSLTSIGIYFTNLATAAMKS